MFGEEGAGHTDMVWNTCLVIMYLAESLNGEKIVVPIFDNCVVNKNYMMVMMLPQLLVDLGLCMICNILFYEAHHGKGKGIFDVVQNRKATRSLVRQMLC